MSPDPSPSETPRRVAVVGGGVAGLTAARDLHLAGHEVHVLEAGPRLGGKIQTGPFADVDLDLGPDAVLARLPWGIDLMRELGLEDQLEPQPPGSAFIWSRGALHRIPEGNVLGVPTDLEALAASGVVSPEAVERAALDLEMPADAPEGDESVGSLIRRRLGDEILERLVDPLLGGINAGDSDRLSLAVGAPQIAGVVHRHASLIEALRAQRAAAPTPDPSAPPAPVFYTLRHGLGQLVEALGAALEDADVRTSSPVASIERAGDAWVVTTEGADALEVDRVVVATPAFVTADLLRPTAPSTADQLAAIEYSSVALVALAFPDDAAGRPLDGTGYLVPRVEGLLLTAASWASSKWPHLSRPGRFIVRASAGRLGDERAMEMDDDALVAAILDDLRTTMDLAGEPSEVRVTRWPRAFPQYTPGHLERVDAIDATLAREAPGIALAGAAYRGVGIPACINSGHQAAAEVA
ncbi:protoporphyrinogen oxidase [Actinomarinicola tropica]|uniref:Coproporphyrinogen III oxidase n=1 Tax=Actinomarinicola tropica TaxID=2789776 RepID=A0A5Q2RQG3_9ACTN|nr:protoporphyrinogen oxidase [Actinomarinicola tropica]QGG96377.1 protoporphyrinogen oxidase [Actinomarinicola tropica]